MEYEGLSLDKALSEAGIFEFKKSCVGCASQLVSLIFFVGVCFFILEWRRRLKFRNSCMKRGGNLPRRLVALGVSLEDLEEHE